MHIHNANCFNAKVLLQRHVLADGGRHERPRRAALVMMLVDCVRSELVVLVKYDVDIFWWVRAQASICHPFVHTLYEFTPTQQDR